MKATYYKGTLILLLLAALLSLCACGANPAPETDSDWLFALQLQTLTPEALDEQLLQRGWERYPAPRAEDGSCYVGTLFGARSALFYAVSAETGLVTGLRAFSMQYAPDAASEVEQRRSALTEDQWDNTRVMQPRSGSAAQAMSAWTETVRAALARADATLPDADASPLPAETEALLDALSARFDTPGVFCTSKYQEGYYRLPDDRYAALSLSALPQENGAAGTVQLTFFLCTGDYRDSDGAQPQLSQYTDLPVDEPLTFTVKAG